MVKRIFLKIHYYLDIRKALKSLSFVLENGRYYIEGNKLYRCEPDSSHYKHIFKIRSKDKYLVVLKEGVFKITPYKYLLLNNDMVFTVVRGNKRYAHIREKLDSYLDKIPYKTMACKFIDKYSLIVSDVVVGNQYDDDAHLQQFIDYYFKHLDLSHIERKKVDMSSKVEEVIFYPQHGDCYCKNIFWRNGEPILIDLDDVDLYPLFYDIFYHVIASKHEEAFTFFRNAKFQGIINSFFADKINETKCDIIDLYLGAYVYFWVNRMERKMTHHEIYFYLQWFEKANLSAFPTVMNAIEQYRRNLKLLGIKDEKRK